MSRVTNLILSMDISEDVEGRMAEIKEYFKGGSPPVSMDDPVLPSGWYGGSKYLEAYLFVGAFNYLNLGELKHYLRTAVQWRCPQFVQLIVKEQDDDVFRIEGLNDEG